MTGSDHYWRPATMPRNTQKEGKRKRPETSDPAVFVPFVFGCWTPGQAREEGQVTASDPVSDPNHTGTVNAHGQADAKCALLSGHRRRPRSRPLPGRVR